MKKKSVKQAVAIVGAGNLGRVLALALHATGYRVTEIITRASSGSKATQLARKVGAKVVEMGRTAESSADVVWICVPDDAIFTVAKELARTKTAWRGKVVLHTSGALNSKELSALKRKGAAVGSAHPMNTFVKTSKANLRGVPFAVEGDARAVTAGTTAGKALGAEVFRIKAEAKVLYHAMGAFSSPLLVSLLYAGERVGREAGLREPRKVMERILRQTVSNFVREGSAAAFSGPIRRGDMKTVQRHLKELRRVQGTEAIYKVLAIQAVHGLPGKEKEAMMKLLGFVK
ncbi:MAG TPA: Rossmann-like and DUF2520 domain-containing protein [Terriglobales bacterium]|nr:Rossmann-like and DUF2520 domain-containing protein [Terriglobales bacterium]